MKLRSSDPFSCRYACEERKTVTVHFKSLCGLILGSLYCADRMDALNVSPHSSQGRTRKEPSFWVKMALIQSSSPLTMFSVDSLDRRFEFLYLSCNLYPPDTQCLSCNLYPVRYTTFVLQPVPRPIYKAAAYIEF
jgi:hypothetical protein